MDYRDLAFYQKARKVVIEINREILTWPKHSLSQDIVRQLMRASTSVGANIAEGHGRHIGAEYIHYLYIAQGSANEVDHWLQTAIDCNLGDLERNKDLIRLNNETRKMLHAAINTLLERQASKTLRETPDPYSHTPLSPNDIEDNIYDELYFS
jgi:four helix bundle protein